ncbi:MAG TPA: hypothetical protein VFE33_27720 [Thermoanaerobaculia bacterium]|nr:hypothetical protein [Thermoanaerobaculia bacterium]
MEKKAATVELEIKLRLPDDIAREAASGGLLEPDSLESMLREELRRRRVDGLFAAADRLAALPIPPLTEAELDSEIQAARARRQRPHARRR